MVILSIHGFLNHLITDDDERYTERYHDTNATLIVDNVYVGSLEEERFTRKKHCNDFPINCINRLLELHNLVYDDVNIVSYTLNSDLVKNNKLIYLSYKNILEENSKQIFKNAEIVFFDHHFAHSIGSFLTSKFDQCNLLSIDGVGTETLIFDEKDNVLKNEYNWGFFGVANSNPFYFHKLKNLSDYGNRVGETINSLGNFYSSLSYLAYKNKLNAVPKNNFDTLSGKIMGLQGYGKKIKINAPEIFSVKSNLNNEIPEIIFNFSIGQIANEYYKEYLIDLSPEDLSLWTQETFENVIINFLSLIPKSYKYDNLCFSGGAALNILLNSKILKNNIYKKIHIHPATSDSGLSVGPALFLAKQNGLNVNLPKNLSLVGLNYSNDLKKPKIIYKGREINFEEFLTHSNLHFKELEVSKINDIVSDNLIENKIVAWYQGNSEYGPRALGNRSILANASFNNKQLLNEKVKEREYWRPYACSVLDEYLNEWFDIPADNSFYMVFSSYVKKEKLGLIPAVTHVDNTCRIQVVNKEQNERFFDLLTCFNKKTNIPLLLNTSFNTLKGEPIVETPLDAVKSFINSNIDILVINNYIITKDYNETHNGKTVTNKADKY